MGFPGMGIHPQLPCPHPPSPSPANAVLLPMPAALWPGLIDTDPEAVDGDCSCPGATLEGVDFCVRRDPDPPAAPPPHPLHSLSPVSTVRGRL